MWRAGSTIAAAVALVLAGGAPAQGFQVTITNKCSESMELYHVVNSEKMEMLAPGKSTSRTLGDISPSNVFKKGRGGQATLAEISGDKLGVWYDISIIPTGPKSGPEYCPSLSACKALTGGVGYNVPMQIIPSTTDGKRCVTLTCMSDGCPDAYLFPKDDGKTHMCPRGTNLEVVFCPGGSGGQTPEPTPKPTSAPTPTPTPSPTPAPTPESTPEPSSNEESGALGSLSSSSSNGTTTSNSAGTNSSSFSITSGDSEVAGEADSAPATSTGAVVATGVKDNADTTTTQISVQSASKSGTGAEVYVLSMLSAVGAVAAAAIVVVRKKKKALDAENVKTPRDRAVTTAAALMLLSTPKDNVTIL